MLFAESLTLSWKDNSSNELGFEIQRSLNGVSFQLLTRVSANATGYVDESVDAATDYWYRVRAYNSAGASGFTNTAKGRVEIASNPPIDPEPGVEPDLDPVGDTPQNQPSSISSPSGGGGFSYASNSREAPTISELSNVALEPGRNYMEFDLRISDPDTHFLYLKVVAESSNTALVPKNGVQIFGIGLDRRLRITPIPGASGASTIKVTVNDGGKSASTSFDFFVSRSGDSKPVIVVHPMQVVANEQDEAVLSVLAIGNPAPSYQWTFNGVPIPGAEEPIFGFSEVSSENEGQYAVVVSNSVGTVASEAVELVVLPPLDIAKVPTRVSRFSPDEVQLSVEVEGEGLSFQWYEGESGDVSSPITGATNAVFVTPIPSEASKYWVRVSQSVGSLLSVNGFRDSEAAIVDYESARFNYFGEIEGPRGCEIGISIQADGAGFFMARIGSGEQLSEEITVISEFELGWQGTFSFEDERIGTISGRVYGATAIVSIGKLDLTCKVSIDSGLGVDADNRGLYGAKILYSSEGQLDLLMGPGGSGFALLTNDSIRMSGDAFLGEGNTIVANIGDDFLIEAQLNSTQGLRGEIFEKGGEDSFEAFGSKKGAELQKQLVNTSIRANLSTGEETMMTNFVIEGSKDVTKRVMVRALGPSLKDFGLEDAVENPEIKLFRLTNDGPILIAENDDWRLGESSVEVDDLSEKMGGLSLDDSPKDAALVAELPAGIYSVFVLNKRSEPGTALVEVFDTDLLDTEFPEANLVNISTRGKVGPGADSTIAGFVVQGNAPKRFLIRAVGRELESYGLSRVLGDTKLTLYKSVQGVSSVVAANDDWGADEVVGRLSEQVGAFPLETDSGSSAMALWLDPGVYSARVSSVSGDSGVALVEVYDVVEDLE